MSQFINKIRDVDPNNNEAIKEALHSFIQSLLKQNFDDSTLWLNELENAINRFPKFCISHRGKIEVLLAQYVDSTNKSQVIEAAKCSHVLQQVRIQQEKNANPKTCWRDQMNILCNAAHLLVGAIFKNDVDIYDYGTQKLHPTVLSNCALTEIFKKITSITNSQNKRELLCNRLTNVFIFMQAMLVEIYPVGKPIRPQNILDVIIRVMSVSSGNKHTDIETTDIKIQALRTLDALVACLGSNLIPFSPLVFRIIMQALRWSSENPSAQAKHVRIASYSSLTAWFWNLRACTTTHDQELTEHILRDITVITKQVQLNINSQPRNMKNMSKKAKRKLTNSMLYDSNIANHIPGEKNKVNFAEEDDDVPIASLKCAEAFLTVCGIFLKPAIHKMFHERIIYECYALHGYSSSRGLWLLRVADASRKSAPPTVPPPTQYCLQLYSVLTNSSDSEISKFCSQALLDIRLHLHCSPPSLNFAIEHRPETSQGVEKRQKMISEENRAALEALLGADKVLEVLQENEDNNIEEPVTKKLRLEDNEEDKISISSESVASVNKDSEGDVELVIEEDAPDSIQISEHQELQLVENPDKNDYDETLGLYEAKTQILVSHSNDTTDGNDSIEVGSSKSNEVSYDHQSSNKGDVIISNRIENDNLPSSNETDDVLITCGQISNSQNINSPKACSLKEEIPKINGSSETSNGKQNENALESKNSVTVKVAMSKEVISVEDMMADFVDEVIDDNVTEA